MVVDSATIPHPYDFTFFTLPGDESSPIQLISPLVADTIDETLFWIPSIKTLIAGDAVYSRTVHVWLADLLSTSLTDAWLSTLDFVEYLKPARIIPGHSLSVDSFGPALDLKHTRQYVTLFKEQVQSKGPGFWTPAEVFKIFDDAFPNLLSKKSATSATLLNITAEEFGIGGTRQVHFVDLAAFNNKTELEGWNLN